MNTAGFAFCIDKFLACAIPVLLWSRLEDFGREAKTNCVSISLLCSKLDTGTGKVINFINFAFMFQRTDY